MKPLFKKWLILLRLIIDVILVGLTVTLDRKSVKGFQLNRYATRPPVPRYPNQAAVAHQWKMPTPNREKHPDSNAAERYKLPASCSGAQ
jgi:hypothetical protein